jgi:hypothetical protein
VNSWTNFFVKNIISTFEPPLWILQFWLQIYIHKYQKCADRCLCNSNWHFKCSLPDVAILIRSFWILQFWFQIRNCRPQKLAYIDFCEIPIYNARLSSFISAILNFTILTSNSYSVTPKKYKNLLPFISIVGKVNLSNWFFEKRYFYVLAAILDQLF